MLQMTVTGDLLVRFILLFALLTLGGCAVGQPFPTMPNPLTPSSLDFLVSLPGDVPFEWDLSQGPTGSAELRIEQGDGTLTQPTISVDLTSGSQSISVPEEFLCSPCQWALQATPNDGLRITSRYAQFQVDTVPLVPPTCPACSETNLGPASAYLSLDFGRPMAWDTVTSRTKLFASDATEVTLPETTTIEGSGQIVRWILADLNLAPDTYTVTFESGAQTNTGRILTLDPTPITYELTLLNQTVPPPVQNFMALESDSRVELTWDDVVEPGLTVRLVTQIGTDVPPPQGADILCDVGDCVPGLQDIGAENDVTRTYAAYTYFVDGIYSSAASASVTPRNVPIPENLQWQIGSADYYSSVYSADGHTFLAAGGGLVLRDSGQGLEDTAYPFNEPIQDIWAADRNNVWLVGNAGTISKYDGTSWFAEASNTSEILRGIWGASAAELVAVGDNGTVLESTGDGNWNVLVDAPTAPGPPVWQDVWGGGSKDEMIVVGSAGRVYDNVVDAGGNWAAAPGTPNQVFHDVHGTPTMDYVFGVGGNGSWVWYDSVSYSSGQFGSLNTIGLRGAFVVEFAGIMYFGDGLGNVHLTLDPNFGTGVAYAGLAGSIEDIHGESEDDLWVVGRQGTIYRREGTVWRTLSDGRDEEITDIYVEGPSSVYVVGFNGTIGYWDGASFQQLTFAGNDVNAVDGIAGTAFAVTSVGEVLSESAAWMPVANTPANTGSSALLDIDVVDTQSFWTVGELSGAEPLVWQFEAGNWTQHSVASSGDISSVFAADNNHVWIGESAAGGGSIQFYDGTTWSDVTPTGLTGAIIDLDGFDKYSVYALADTGTLYAWTGGPAWLEIGDAGLQISEISVVAPGDVYGMSAATTDLYWLTNTVWAGPAGLGPEPLAQMTAVGASSDGVSTTVWIGTATGQFRSSTAP